MLQTFASRVCAITIIFLSITTIIYMTLTRTSLSPHFYSPSSQGGGDSSISGWGPDWASLLGPGERLESTTMRSPSGNFFLTLDKSNGDLIFEDREMKKNTTLFGVKEVGGERGLEEGVHVPDGATWHAMLTRRGIFVVFFDFVLSSPPSPPTTNEENTETQGRKRDDDDIIDLNAIIKEIIDAQNESADDDDEAEEPNHGLGTMSFAAWDSNRIPDCHILPKYAPANSAPFIQLDDRGSLYISTANEINCVLKHPEGRRALR